MKVKALLLVLGVIFAALSYFAFGKSETHVLVYKQEVCGCCDKYAEYLEEGGYSVEIVNVSNLKGIYEKHGVPRKLWSCHVSYIGNYFVVGHVPREVFDRLLGEKPEIDGISLPGMPTGSPGMPGLKKGNFRIYSITNGEVRTFAEI